MTDRHDDLSAAELLARLSQRGVPTLDADWLVANRDEPEAAEMIHQWLTGDRRA